MKNKIVITQDQSPTLYVPELDEHYHSVFGAIQESQHVFINAGLNYIKKNSINILEIGFGTGLNCLLSLKENALLNKVIYYETIEKYPVDISLVNQLEFIKDFKKEFLKLHTSDWGKIININDKFILKKIKTDLLEFTSDKKFDLVYFDAFSPDKQAYLWTEDIFKKIYNAVNTEGVLVTYSAKGIIKQALRKVGFGVKRLPGPKGKRHMIRAVKTDNEQII